MALGRIRLGTRRFGSAESRLDAIACNISGLIYTISTNPIASSFKEVLTPYFNSTRIRPNAIFIWQIY
jgi:hypothetical protein